MLTEMAAAVATMARNTRAAANRLGNHPAGCFQEAAVIADNGTRVKDRRNPPAVRKYPTPCRGLVGAAVLLLAGCQLYLPDSARDDDDNDGGNGDSTLSLRVLGSPGGGFNDVDLVAFGVRLYRSEGGSSEFEFAERSVSLFAAGDGAVLLDGVTVPAGRYERIRLRLRGDEFDTGWSRVEDGLGGGTFPLAIPLDRADFDVDFSTSRNSSRTITLVVHTQSAVAFEDEEQPFFSFRPAGYAVRTDGDRAGRVQGTLPNTCDNSPGMDDLAVYVFRPEAEPDEVRDIRGGSGVHEPLVSFAAGNDGGFLSPPLPPGDWRFAWTCRALNDNPDEADSGVRDDLRATITEPFQVLQGETRELTFTP